MKGLLVQYHWTNINRIKEGERKHLVSNVSVHAYTLIKCQVELYDFLLS